MSNTVDPNQVHPFPEISVGKDTLPTALLRLFQEAARSAVLLSPRWDRVTPSAAIFALIFLLGVAVDIGLHRLYVVGPATFYWRALASGWLMSAILGWVCYLLASPTFTEADHASASGPQLFALAWAQMLVLSLVFGLVVSASIHGGTAATRFMHAGGQWAIWIGSISWSVVTLLVLLLRSSPRTWVVRTVAAAVLIGAYGVMIYAQPSMYWYAQRALAETASSELTLSQETFEAQQHLFAAQLAAIKPQRPGVIDLYAITFAPYAEESVFKKESGVVADVMRHRFDADGRTLQLLNHNQTTTEFAWATPLNLQRAIQHFGAVMDRTEDILFIHLTSHGARNGELAASFGPLDVAPVTPVSLKKWLDDAGIRHRVISISACYSGSWIDTLANNDTLVMTAADADHTSYGCGSLSELTFFGRAMYDEQLRNQTLSFEQAHKAARILIKRREEEAGKDDGYSNPQIRVGSAIRARLAALQARLANP